MDYDSAIESTDHERHGGVSRRDCDRCHRSLHDSAPGRELDDDDDDGGGGGGGGGSDFNSKHHSDLSLDK